MKKNRNLFVNLDRDSVCFAIVVLALTGIAATVGWDTVKMFKESQVKKEKVMNNIKTELDTAKTTSANIMGFVSGKQK